MNRKTIRCLTFALVAIFGYGAATPTYVEAGQKTVHVQEHKRKDGTVVKAHDRRTPSKKGSSATRPSSSSPSSPAAESNTAEAIEVDVSLQTVYVTRTGEKYHRAGCRYLARSSIPMVLKEARKVYSACSVCKPPTF